MHLSKFERVLAFGSYLTCVAQPQDVPGGWDDTQLTHDVERQTKHKGAATCIATCEAHRCASLIVFRQRKVFAPSLPREHFLYHVPGGRNRGARELQCR